MELLMIVHMFGTGEVKVKNFNSKPGSGSLALVLVVT